MKKLAVFILPFLLVGVWAYSTERWRYFDRVLNYPSNPITDFEWYDTVQEINGAFVAPLAKTTNSSIAIEAIQRVREYVHQTPKSSLVILHRGQLVAESYPPNERPNQLTNSMSMAKSVTALLIGIAIDDGKISGVDDAVAKYLPSWSNDMRKDITLRHLLVMSSGLRCNNDPEDLTSDLIRLHLGTDILNLAINLRAEEAPGLRFQYNNFNSQILSLVLERATGTPFERYLSEKLWKPIGAQPAFVWRDTSAGAVRAYCCIFARARDFARIGQLFLDRGKVGEEQIVSEKWIQMMGTRSELEPEYGLHLWRASPDGKRRLKHRKGDFLDSSMVYMDGKHIQRVYILPKYELVIVRTGERPSSWDDAFLPNTLVNGLVQSSSVTIGQNP